MMLRRCTLAGASAVLAVALAPAGARAENGWEAKWLGQSGYPTLESGETVTSHLDVQNVGQKTWTPSNTLLGASNPRDRDSAFQVPGTWVSPDRIVAIDRTLPPGATGRFTFPMRAPEVASTTLMREYFEPVADDPSDSGWMGMTADWAGVYLDYTVLAPQNPSVQFNSAPFAVERGRPIELVATATDNGTVAGVTFGLRGREGTVAGEPREASSYAGRLDTANLSPGGYDVVVRAVDRAGRASEATTGVTVREPQPQRAESGPPAWTVRLRTSWRYRGRTTRVVALTPSGLAADATVALRCTGRGCPFRRRAVKTAGRSLVRLARPFRRTRLRAGARIVLTVARPDNGARTYTFRMRPGRLPAVRESCTSPAGASVDCGR